MNNPTTYIEKLDKSMTRKEKLFFLNKINWKEYGCVIDFGGANGRLLWEVDKYLTKHRLDKDNRILLVNVEVNDQLKDAYEYKREYLRHDSIDFTLEVLCSDARLGKTLIIFSSVLHELDEQTLDELNFFISKAHTDVTIVVRDMFWSNTTTYGGLQITRFGYNFDIRGQIAKLSAEEQLKLKAVIMHDYSYYGMPNYCRYPEKAWYEYLLKWNYTDNWETEVKEHYFNGHAHDFIIGLALRGEVKYEKHYILPYKKREVRKKFGFKMEHTTHLKLIVELKEKW